MSESKYVISMEVVAMAEDLIGSMDISKKGVDLVPVDVYVPGCPPRPEALIHGILELQKHIHTQVLWEK